MKLTARTVDATKPEAVRRLLWDAELRGFGLRVEPTGRKVYVVKYRVGGGRAGRVRWFVIGAHGSPWTAEGARKEAARLLAEVRIGSDPAGDRTEERVAPTLNELADAFEKRHLTRKAKASTSAAYRGLLARYVRPKLGARKARDVSVRDIAKLHDEMQDTPRQANYALAILSKMFTEGGRWGFVPEGHNPARGIQRYPEAKRDRFLSEDEMNRLWKALAAAEASGEENGHALAALRLLLLTGARLSEILTLRWEWVDFGAACLRLPDSKTGAKVVRLNGPAVALLRNLPRVQGNPHVIPAARPGKVQGAATTIAEGEEGGHFVGIQRVWQRVRERAKLPEVRIHDLRHTFASWGAMSGIGLSLMGELLGHRHTATTARYAHFAAEAAQRASEVVGKRIAAAVGEAKAPRGRKLGGNAVIAGGEAAEVVALPSARRRGK